MAECLRPHPTAPSTATVRYSGLSAAHTSLGRKLRPQRTPLSASFHPPNPLRVAFAPAYRRQTRVFSFVNIRKGNVISSHDRGRKPPIPKALPRWPPNLEVEPLTILCSNLKNLLPVQPPTLTRLPPSPGVYQTLAGEPSRYKRGGASARLRLVNGLTGMSYTERFYRNFKVTYLSRILPDWSVLVRPWLPVPPHGSVLHGRPERVRLALLNPA